MSSSSITMDSPTSPSPVSNISFDSIESENSIIDHQKDVLYRHFIFVRNRDFNLLVQSGLMNQLVTILEDDDRKRETFLSTSITNTPNNTTGENTSGDDDDDSIGPIIKKSKTSHITTHDIYTQTD